MQFKGAITAMVTPFKEDESLDIEGLKKNIEFQISNGISGLVPLGTTGESPTITAEERTEIIKTVVATVNKRVLVIVGTGTNSTQTTIEHTKEAKELGADAAIAKKQPTGDPKQLETQPTSKRIPVPM